MASTYGSRHAAGQGGWASIAIYCEIRLAKLKLKTKDQLLIDNEVDELAANGAAGMRVAPKADYFGRISCISRYNALATKERPRSRFRTIYICLSIPGKFIGRATSPGLSK